MRSEWNMSSVIRKVTTPPTVGEPRPLFRFSVYQLQILVFPGTEESDVRARPPHRHISNAYVTPLLLSPNMPSPF